MAERPVFLPVEAGSQLVQEVPVEFTWHAGMAPSQKKKNVAALHHAASLKGLSPLLEISSKSDAKVGQRLSAFSLRIKIDGKLTSVESAYQGSKVFERGGPFVDLYNCDSRSAKGDPRLRESGRLVEFRFEGSNYPLSPATAFYDWLYVRSLFPHRSWLRRLQICVGFTDIEFNPERSLNCQARSFATLVALDRRGLLDEAASSFERFRAILVAAGI